MKPLFMKKPIGVLAALALLSFSLLSTGCSNTKPPAYSDLNNQKQPFKVQIRSTKSPLKLGELLQLQIRSMSEGFINLYTVSSSGKVASLLENRPIKGGQNLYFPSPRSVADYRIGPPLGTETYIVLVSRKKLNWIAPSDRLNHNLGLTTLNLNKNQLIRRLQQSVTLFPKDDWNMSTLSLQIVD